MVHNQQFGILSTFRNVEFANIGLKLLPTSTGVGGRQFVLLSYIYHEYPQFHLRPYRVQHENCELFDMRPTRHMGGMIGLKLN